jgi:hypothetical protein
MPAPRLHCDAIPALHKQTGLSLTLEQTQQCEERLTKPRDLR